MKDQINQLKNIISSAQRILITSHISPDPDALCSVLLAGMALEANYPNKNVCMSMEELTGELNFLNGYEKITQQSLLNSLNDFQPDLIIILDAMSYARCTRGDATAVKAKVDDLGCKLIIVDHHEPEGIEDNEVYINNSSPACAQDAYEIFIKDMPKKPAGYAQAALLGILSDTNRFLYDNPQHRHTFDMVDELIDAGASIEGIVNKGSRFSVDDMGVLSELTKNVNTEKDFTYSFISDEFIESWQQQNKTADDLKRGSGYFVNEFIRNIGQNLWGFVVYRDLADDNHIYSVSFRSLSGLKNISEIAKKLGGGGHKAAAGAKFGAVNVQDAIDKVKEAIATS